MNIVDYCEKVGVSVEDIKGRNRREVVVAARHVWWYHLHIEYGYNHCEISRMSDRDHSTVHHGIHRVRDLIRLKDKFIGKYLEAIGIIYDSKYKMYILSIK